LTSITAIEYTSITSIVKINKNQIAGNVSTYLWIWDYTTGEFIKKIDLGITITGLLKINKNQIIYSSGYLQLIYDLSTEEDINSIIDINNIYGSLLKISDKLIATSDNSSIKILEFPKLRCVTKFTVHTSPVRDLIKFSKNKIVSCYIDLTIKVWDLKTAKCLKKLLRKKYIVVLVD